MKTKGQMIMKCMKHSDHSNGFEYLYEQLLDRARNLPWGIPFVEIGTRGGGSALLALNAIKESNVSRPLITIDPYGKWYSDSNISNYQPMGESRYREAMKLLSEFCSENNLVHSHFRMTSEDFIQIWDTVGLWVGGENINDRKFGFVYLDGEHRIETVEREFEWFLSRMYPKGLIIFDDTEHIKDKGSVFIDKAFELGTENVNRLFLRVDKFKEPVEEEKKVKKNRYALVTICVGDVYDKMAKTTHPNLKAYAKKIGADFIKIDGSMSSTPHWEKFKIFEILDHYERVLYVDTDIMIRDDCPNIFDIVPPYKLGMFNEAPFTGESRRESLVDACKAHGLLIPDWNGKYYNSGVMVISREHKHLFRKPEREDFNFYEQGYLNAIIAYEKTVMHDLDYKFNRMYCMDLYTGEERYDSYMMHYAGIPSFDMILDLMPKDLENWQINGPEYKYQKHILIDVQGGLGDQINCEPTIRFMMEHIYPEDDVIVKTHFPEVFQHIKNIEVFLHEDFEWTDDTPYYKVISLPGPETLMWSCVSNLLCHTVDYCSMSILHRTLPVKDKTPMLTYNEKDIESLYETIKIDVDLKEFVLVHPGKHWESKSFPIEWWQEVVDGLHKEGLKVCIIGKDEYTRGVLDVELREGMIDLRNKTSLTELFALISQAKVVISNDSAPIHIAGAFDNYIILIPSCKHEDHLLPWRQGNQYYKSAALYKREMVYDFISAPTTINPPEELNGQYLPPGKTWSDYLPSLKQVIDKAIEFYYNEIKEEVFI
jgi:hypothetical protein